MLFHLSYFYGIEFIKELSITMIQAHELFNEARFNEKIFKGLRFENKLIYILT